MQTFTITSFLLALLLVVSTSLSAQAPYRMNLGNGGPFTYGSVTFLADNGFDGQSTKGGTSDDIGNTPYDDIYQTQRFVNGWGGYTESNWQQCGFTPGEYTLHLHFAEIYNIAAGNRSFDISVEGNLVVDDLDVFSVAGHDMYTVVSVNFTISGDGCVNLSMINGSVDFAMLSAIEIVALGTPEFHSRAFPVELVNFDAKAINGAVALNWTTASEQNSDHFVVERSIDGQNYKGIEKVAAQGNSNQLVSYDMVDNTPISGTTYYRLKDVDIDGGYSYSAVIEVSLEGSINFSVLSNPTSSDQVRFRIANNAHDFTATVLDAQGKVITRTKFGGNTQIGTLNLGNVPTGIYYLTVENFDFTQEAKLMIH